MSMYCYQCEQTAKASGCTSHGVCGKGPDTACLQDALVHVCKGISQDAHCSRQQGRANEEIDHFVAEAMFSTLTNVNFDPQRFVAFIRRATAIRDQARRMCEQACQAAGQECGCLEGPAGDDVPEDRAGMIDFGQAHGIHPRIERLGADVTGLQELTVYGVKGACAYLDHAHQLGVSDEGVYGQMHELLAWVAGEPTSIDALKAKALEAGGLNLRAMALLDAAHTGKYGHPEPTEVRVTPVAGKCIVVSGHDLRDLERLLKQTEGKGIHVYTHGEMLPCNAYPELKKYDHLAGNYGGAWQDQRDEFEAFPGAILMTTNCLMQPKDSYRDRLFTTGLVGWEDVTHVEEKDFTPVIECALQQPGFAEDAPEKTITVGFARNSVLGVADKVVDAVKAGDLRHFFLIGGCDGAKPGRNYYTELAERTPKDCVILTLACGKYRFNKLEFGDIGGIPRLLDVGQCNDAYSAVQIALALADAFDCDVNDLPLSLVLSWYEQKAVAILLTLLHLGIEDIRLGPTLPAFVTDPVLQVLVEEFGLKPITTPAEDLEAILG